MGTQFNFQRLHSATDDGAIAEGTSMIAQAMYDYGHAGYTGSWAECRGTKLVAAHIPLNSSAYEWLRASAETCGPMLIVKFGEHYYAGAQCAD